MPCIFLLFRDVNVIVTPWSVWTLGFLPRRHPRALLATTRLVDDHSQY